MRPLLTHNPEDRRCPNVGELPTQTMATQTKSSKELPNSRAARNEWSEGTPESVILRTGIETNENFPLPATVRLGRRSLKTLTKSDFPYAWLCFGWLVVGFDLALQRILIGGSVCLVIATYLFYAGTKAGPAFPASILRARRPDRRSSWYRSNIMVKSFPPAIRFSGISLSYKILCNLWWIDPR